MTHRLRTSAGAMMGLLLMVSMSVAQTPARQVQPGTATYGNISVETVVPVISVETTGPADINVGKTATFYITVKNVGDVPAEGVVVRTHIPNSVDFENSNPRPEAVEEGVVRFYLGDLAANATKRIAVNLVPRRRGSIDLATRASFSTTSQSSLQVRQSNLKLQTVAPPRAVFGENVTMKVVVTNAGDGPAEGVVVTPKLPDGTPVAGEMTKPMEVGVLPPGESRELLYTLMASVAGGIDLGFEATDSNGGQVSSSARIRILRPMLKVTIQGPSMRYLNRSGDYEIHVSNPGDTPVHNVEVIAAIGSGLRVTAIAKAANYDNEANTLTWYLDSVDPGSETVLPLKAVGTEVGESFQQVVVTNNAGLVANAERVTQIVSRPNIYATVINDAGSAEVYQPTNFTVLLVNRGSSIAENVDVSVSLADELEPLPSDEANVNGNEMKFDPITLNVGEQQELHFQAISRTAGDHTVRVAYQIETMTYPLTIEGLAHYYDDNQPAEIADRLETNSIGPQLVPR